MIEAIIENFACATILVPDFMQMTQIINAQELMNSTSIVSSTIWAFPNGNAPILHYQKNNCGKQDKIIFDLISR